MSGLKKLNRFWLYSLIGALSLFEMNIVKASEFRRDESLQVIAGQSGITQINDTSIVERLLRAYNSSIIKDDNRGTSVWKIIYDAHHSSIDIIFRKGLVKESSAILREPHSSNLLYGIDMLGKEKSSEFQKNPSLIAPYAAKCLDGLIRFAEAIGAVRLDNPESYYFLPPAKWSADSIINAIEKSLRQSISFPNPYPYEYGVASSKGIISYRTVQALYQTWRIKQVLKDIPHPRVLEIGAGLGRTAYYAREFGIEDYTIVDLPFTCVISGYFLARTLGDDQVVLYGEQAANQEKLIKFLTPDEFMNGNEKYDLIINVDSMTEMDLDMARAYMNKIQSSTGLFLSVNHEVNPFTVKELIDELQSVAHVDRMPYWMRRGYVEEIVQFKSLND